MADKGGVKHLDTNKFSSTIKAFKDGVKKYDEIKKGVRHTSEMLFDYWSGDGRNQFEKDYNTIYRQLSDIGDIMYELYDSLIDAQATYMATDDEAAKMMNTK